MAERRRRSKQRSKSGPPKRVTPWTVVGTAAIVVCIVALVGAVYVAMTRDTGPDVVANAAPTTTVPVTDFSVNGDLSSVRPALASPAPYVITVLGDSTGNEPTEWVYLTAQRISDEFNRPITVHNWLMESNYYNTETVIGGDKTGAPVTIWNGSASGQSADYSGRFFSVMAPEQPDLVIVNHGHNALSTLAQTNGIAGLNNLIDTTWPTKPVVAYVLQNPRVDAKADSQNAVVDATKTLAEKVGAGIIDVHTPFSQAPNLTELLRADQFHPSDQGEQLWATTVEQALGV